MTSRRQIEANRRNWSLRRGLTPEGRERLRAAAFRLRPWEHSTGLRTDAGRRRSRENAVYFGDFCKSIEPLAAANAATRAEGAFGSAAAIVTVLAHRKVSGIGPESEAWARQFLEAIAVLMRARQEQNAAWRRFAVALGLPEPAESSAEGIGWCGHVLDHGQSLTDVMQQIALGFLCLATARAWAREAFGLHPNMQPMRTVPSLGNQGR
jgi:hypothetical protein